MRPFTTSIVLAITTLTLTVIGCDGGDELVDQATSPIAPSEAALIETPGGEEGIEADSADRVTTEQELDDTASTPRDPEPTSAPDDFGGIWGGFETEPDANEPGGLRFAPLSDQGDVVAFVEIDRYMGRWFEIATTPSFQQAFCFATEANYAFNATQGWVDVVNSCRIGDTSGRMNEIQGRAELVDLETQAKLNVIFFGQSAPYWVVALDGSAGIAPYSWAVVSVPGGGTMWLLSRTSRIDDATRAAIEAHLSERGFDVDQLVDTIHAE